MVQVVVQNVSILTSFSFFSSRGRAGRHGGCILSICKAHEFYANFECKVGIKQIVNIGAT